MADSSGVYGQMKKRGDIKSPGTGDVLFLLYIPKLKSLGGVGRVVSYFRYDGIVGSWDRGLS